MPIEKSNVQKRIESGKPVILAEITPPASSDAAEVKALAAVFAGKVHGLGVGDNREGVTMSALAAASIVRSEGIEPLLHVATRDRNRAALVSDFLGAQALGIRNFLCTSGTHQALGPFRSAKNVFDIDATILLQTFKNLGKDASIIGAGHLDGTAPVCLGAVASPYADPVELQLSRLAQKIFIGAQFIITHPVFDMERFEKWWSEVTTRGLHRNAAFIAEIRVLTDANAAARFSGRRPLPMVPDSLLERLASKKGPERVRAEGIAIAVETIERLSSMEGLRGFEIMGDDDPKAVAEVLDVLKPKLE